MTRKRRRNPLLLLLDVFVEAHRYSMGRLQMLHLEMQGMPPPLPLNRVRRKLKVLSSKLRRDSSLSLNPTPTWEEEIKGEAPALSFTWHVPLIRPLR